ncbi:SURF1 family protein [Yinghuangia seranimata]|uniref:SURF1 family cytochrome oxidase biogenesis protein n=1 Tax=Yinghuangia seranimata TaxID=408067 RepID=UPI00248BDE96|nr:SURF1 family protein [Yinghuangia seranimata]MDI2126346.1 SURF1 family protein [Yinghuangia seranimata]
MYRFLLTPRWIALNLLVVLLIPVMIKLGFWQLHRYEAKAERNDRLSANRGHTPVPVGDLFAVDRDIPASVQWRKVSATGHYDAAHELLIRGRTNDNVYGFYVVTPLITGDGTALLVNRGWVKASEDSAAVRPVVPAAPKGEVTVVARARPAETRARSGIRDNDGLPAGIVMRIDTEKLAPTLPYPVFGGYGQLVEETPKPAEAPTALGTPESEDTGLNMAYAVQWWIFVVALVAMWVKVVRREAAELEAELAALDAAEAEADAEPEPAPAPVTPAR